MHTEYADILSRISDPVLWFDEHAVPRFDPFRPDLMANIYAYEAALVRVECQGCGKAFKVAFSDVRGQDALPKGTDPEMGRVMIRDHIRARTLHFGDPPNVRCCSAGPTMNSVPRQVLEYWVKPYVLGEGVTQQRVGDTDLIREVISDLGAMDWRRDPQFESDITPDWAD